MKKQSKVYEAAEGVENMPIKQTKMNHKKCTPGEFGAMVKEAVNPKTIMNLGRQAVGGVSGALTQGAPQAARKAMLDQRDAIGFVRDFGGAIGRPAPRSYVRDSLQQAGRDAFRGQVQGNAIAAAGAAGAGIGAGYGAKYQTAYRDEANQLQQNAQPAVPSLPPAATQGIGSRIKANSARDFGAYVKQSFDIQKYLPAAGVGAGLGAGVGALSGLINPGEEDEYDDEGRVIGRKQRSRFGAMLRGGLMGAGLGGVAGGAAQHFAGPQTEKALNYMRGLFARPQQNAPQQNEIASDEVLQKNLRDSRTTPAQFGPDDQKIMEQAGVKPGLPVDLSAIYDVNSPRGVRRNVQYFKDNPFATLDALTARELPATSATPVNMRKPAVLNTFGQPLDILNGGHLGVPKNPLSDPNTPTHRDFLYGSDGRYGSGDLYGFDHYRLKDTLQNSRVDYEDYWPKKYLPRRAR